jgi:hypothetical protein
MSAGIVRRTRKRSHSQEQPSVPKAVAGTPPPSERDREVDRPRAWALGRAGRPVNAADGDVTQTHTREPDPSTISTLSVTP